MTMFSRLMIVAGLTAALLLGADSVIQASPWDPEMERAVAESLG